MRFLICFVMFMPVAGFSQNLLVNPGFEVENICSEYKVNCAPEGWIYSVPSFIYYFQDADLAHEGSRFVALIAGHSKNHITELCTQPLIMQFAKRQELPFGVFCKINSPNAG